MKLLKRTLLTLAFLLCWIGNSHALVYDYMFVSPTGTGDCSSAASPCTMQHAVDISVDGRTTVLYPAPGTYPGDLNVVYYRVINIAGDCSNYANVKIGGSIGVTGQDHAIVTLSCLTITSSTTGVTSRQFTIIDVDGVVFGPMTWGIVATEKSKINVCGVSFYGNMAYVLGATGNSDLYLGCNVTFINAITMNAFLYAVYSSFINAGGATFTNLATGPQYINDHSLIIRSGGYLPGSTSGNVLQSDGYVE